MKSRVRYKISVKATTYLHSSIQSKRASSIIVYLPYVDAKPVLLYMMMKIVNENTVLLKWVELFKLIEGMIPSIIPIKKEKEEKEG